MKMSKNFEETCREFPILGGLITKANPTDKEVLKRLFGFASPLLGKGPTKAEHAMNTLKFIVDELIKRPVREQQQTDLTENENEDTEVQNKELNNESQVANGEKIPEARGSLAHQNNEDGFQTVKKRICHHFANNNCKRGLECKFAHPEICPTFAKFGPYRETNTRGCKGRNCELLHARTKWCRKAIRFNKCLNHNCKYEHFRGTITHDKINLERKKENQPRNSKPARAPGMGQHQYTSYSQAVKSSGSSPAEPTAEQNQAFLGINGLGLQQIIMAIHRDQCAMMNRMSEMERKLVGGGSPLRL